MALMYQRLLYDAFSNNMEDIKYFRCGNIYGYVFDNQLNCCMMFPMWNKILGDEELSLLF